MNWIKELISQAGKAETSLETLLTNQIEVFNRLNELKSNFDRRMAVSAERDKLILKLVETADSNRAKISELHKTVENGLKSKTEDIGKEVNDLKIAINKLVDCSRKRQESLSSSIDSSWDWLRNKVGKILVVGGLISILTLVLNDCGVIHWLLKLVKVVK